MVSLLPRPPSADYSLAPPLDPLGPQPLDPLTPCPLGPFSLLPPPSVARAEAGQDETSIQRIDKTVAVLVGAVAARIARAHGTT